MQSGLLAGVRRHDFDNGLVSLVHPDFSTPVVALNLWLRVGSNYETDAVRGWSHGIEHMLFKGTDERKTGDIGREVRTLGGTLNAATGYETTNYYIVVPADAFERAHDIHFDVFSGSVFREEDLANERRVLIEELKMYEDVPEGFGFTWDEFMRVAFVRHPYRHSVLGTAESLEKTPREEILRYFESTYVPANMIYAVCGAVDPARVEDLVARRLGSLPARPSLPYAAAPEPRQDAFRYVALTGDVEQAYFKIGFHVPEELHRDTPALKVFLQLLGGGRSSRLHLNVVERKGLVSSIGIIEEAGRDPGIVVIDGVTTPEELEDAIRATYEEIERFRREPIEPKDREKAFNNVIVEFLGALESVQGQSSVLGRFEVLGDYRMAETYPDRIASVTADDVVRAANEYLDFERSTVVTYTPGARSGPDRSAEAAMRDRLRPVAPARSESAIPAAEPSDSVRAAVSSPPRRGARAAGEISVHTLPGGARLVVRPNDKLPLVALAAYARAGQRFEPAEKHGVGVLTARTLIKGTASMDNERLAEEIERYGITLYPFSDRDTSGFYLEAMRTELDRALDLFADIISEPAFGAAEVEREREIVLADIAQEMDDTLEHTMKVFMSRLFDGHPYGRSLLGTPESVRAIGRDDLSAWHHRFFVPSNLALAAVGDLVPDAFVDALAGRLDRLRRGEAPEPPVFSIPELCAPGRTDIARDKAQSVVVLGMPAPSAHSDDRFALAVLNGILSGMGSRLWAELRDARHLCYYTGSFYSPLDGAGVFGAYIGTSPDRVKAAIESLMGELTKVRDALPTEEEWRRSINALVSGRLIGMQTNGSQAAAFARAEALGFGYRRVLEFPERVRAVTREDVLRVAREVITLDRHALVVLTPNPASAEATVNEE
jgi:zinc protease